MSAINQIFHEIWRQKCHSVSGTELDTVQNERLYQYYRACSTDAIDFTQLREDAKLAIQSPSLTELQKSNIVDAIHQFIWIFTFVESVSRTYLEDYVRLAVENATLAELHHSNIVAVIQKYCPKRNAYMGCKQMLSPVFSECYTAEENYGQLVRNNITFSVLDFICERNAEHAIEFINGKVIACAADKQSELISCIKRFVDDPPSHFDMNLSVFGLVEGMVFKATYLCKSVATIGNCIVPLFKQCESSTVPGKLFESLFKYLQKDTECANVNL